MDERELLKLSAVQLEREIRRGAVTAVEITEAALRRVEAMDPGLNSFITVDAAGARAQAERVQRRLDAGEDPGPLAGVPVAVKDNICARGLRTTCGSRALEDFVPSYEAEAAARLRRAGAVILGKTNMDEFAMGSTTETSAWGPTRNPWNPSRVPGGSSGGSCAAVASGEAFCALGSDTGGSVRQPASLCGVVGLKPTYGMVSRWGLVAYGSSLDQIGPVARTVEDCAVLLDVIAGHDRKDSMSVPEISVECGRKDCVPTAAGEGHGRFSSALGQGVRGLRIGLPRDYFGEGLDPEVASAVRRAAQVLAEQGAVVEDFDLGLTSYAVPAYYTIASAEASSNLARFDGMRYGHRAADCAGLDELYRRSRSESFGAEVKRRILLGTFVLSAGYYDAYFLKALRVRALIKQAFDRAFADHDIIMGPTVPGPAPVLGESLQDPLRMYLGDIYTVAANLAGLPAISIPCGLDSSDMPIGVQLTADCRQERRLLAAAYCYEQARDFPGCPAMEPEMAEPGFGCSV